MISPTPSPSRAIICICMCTLAFSYSALSFSLSTTVTSSKTTEVVGPDPSSPSTNHNLFDLPKLSGAWSHAKQSLRNPQCCVASVSGLEQHLSTLQQYFCDGEDAPSDLDLRMRIRCSSTNNSIDVKEVAYEDCAKVYSAVMGTPSRDDDEDGNNLSYENKQFNHPCILALEEIARGVASLADGPLEKTCTDVHMRVVCASNYQAIDPMFHTDKCPLRGYVTLTGSGTEYMDETCHPWEYVALRSLGVDGLAAISGKDKAQRLKSAKELEFIVMKGDHYDAPLPVDPERKKTPSSISANRLWSRSSACVHRSPPGDAASSSSGNTKGGLRRRRVILSLDLADGTDDQEWYEIRRKRGWRSGMTQRKSRLVS